MAQFESDPTGPISIDHYVDDSDEPTTREPKFDGFLDYLSTQPVDEGADARSTPGSEDENEYPPRLSPGGSAVSLKTQEFPLEYDEYDEDEEEGDSPAGPSPPRELFRSDRHLSHDHSMQQERSYDSSQDVEASGGDGSPLVLGDDESFGNTDSKTAAMSAGSFYESFTSAVDKVLHPTFNSNGTFVGYEARGNQDIPLNGSSRGRVGARMLNKKYVAMLILSFVAVISVVFVVLLASGGKKQGGQPTGQEALDFAQLSASANTEPAASPHHSHHSKTQREKKQHEKEQHEKKQREKKEHAKKHQQYKDKHPLAEQYKHKKQNSTSPTSSPVEYDANGVHTLAEVEAHAPVNSTHQLRIKPEAVATTKKSHPDDEFSGLQELAVEHGQRVSYLRFAIASNMEEGDNSVRKARLNLYLKAHSGGENTSITLAVKKLPDAGEWIDQSVLGDSLLQRVSWNNPPDGTTSYLVDTLQIGGLQDGETKRLIELDVTSSLFYQTRQDFVTFELAAESVGDLWFASEQWKEGEAAPELVITLNNI